MVRTQLVLLPLSQRLLWGSTNHNRLQKDFKAIPTFTMSFHTRLTQNPNLVFPNSPRIDTSQDRKTTQSQATNANEFLLSTYYKFTKNLNTKNFKKQICKSFGYRRSVLYILTLLSGVFIAITPKTSC